ncbi:MAG: FmdE family protein [Phycisphaerae bacterium]
MNEPDLPDDLKRCVAFHGHLCPGLVIGYCAAKLGMRELSAGRSDDEEIIAIVENDTCAVDAVQVLTGCTFGKGNLFFRDHGKMVFTFATRADGRSVRLSLRPIKPPGVDDLPEDQRRRHHIEFMLAHDPSEFFAVRKNPLKSLPTQARIRESIRCEACGEMVMSTRLRKRGNTSVCIPCFDTAKEQ